MDKPNIFFGVGEIVFVFGCDKVVVEKDSAKVFLNGVEQFGFRKPNSFFCKKVSFRYPKKILVKLKLVFGEFMVTKGIDGRLFFSFWDSPEKYAEHGRKADWVASYFLHGEKKEWFEQDLFNPKEVF